MESAFFENYEVAILALGALAFLLVVQIIVADVVGFRSKHIPGEGIAANHSSLLFRASRTVANTNESIAAFIVLVLFCIFSGASAAYTGYLSWGYVLARSIYAICYYLNQQILRSVCFGISIFMLVGMLLVGLFT